MKAFQEIEVELTRLRLLEPQLLKRITELERENKTIEQLQIEAAHWKRKSENERSAFSSLLHCSYQDPKCTTIEDALLRAHIEAEHWKQAYYEERAKYLNLINNK